MKKRFLSLKRALLVRCPSHKFLFQSKLLVSRSEIIDWHECFYTDSPGGAMNQFEFTKMYCQFFPKGDPTEFSKFLFKNFDENGDGSIEFTEFLSAISMTSRGSIEQKLECKLHFVKQLD